MAKVPAAPHAITGGLGGLGLRAAQMLAERGATRVLLASRGGRMACSGLGFTFPAELLDTQSSTVAVFACDSSDVSSVGALRATNAFGGILHAAGVLRDRMFRAMSSADVCFAFEPKALGASYIHHMTALTPLEAMGLFSSVASTFGNVGQSNYAAANACMDALALNRRKGGRVSSSLQIPAVRGSGMGASTFDAAQMDAIGAISLDEFAGCLHASVAAARPASMCTLAPLKQMLIAGLPRLAILTECRVEGTAASSERAPLSMQLSTLHTHCARAIPSPPCGDRQKTVHEFPQVR